MAIITMPPRINGYGATMELQCAEKPCSPTSCLLTWMIPHQVTLPSWQQNTVNWRHLTAMLKQAPGAVVKIWENYIRFCLDSALSSKFLLRCILRGQQVIDNPCTLVLAIYMEDQDFLFMTLARPGKGCWSVFWEWIMRWDILLCPFLYFANK